MRTFSEYVPRLSSVLPRGMGGRAQCAGALQSAGYPTSAAPTRAYARNGK